MLNANESRAGASPVSAIADIEKRMEDLYTAQKNEVEQGLLEKINREKEEAQRKIEAARQEFEKVRGILEEHRAVMAELESARESLQARIQEHVDRALDHQSQMEKAAAVSVEELQRIEELNRELDGVRRRAAEQTAALRDQLKGHSAIAPQLPEFPESPSVDVDWSRQLLKMKKVQAILSSSNGSDAQEAAPATPSTEPSAPAATPEPPAVEPGPETEPEQAAAPASTPASNLEPEPMPESAPAPEPMPEPPAAQAAPPSDELADTAEFPESDPGWDDIPAPRESDGDALPEEPSSGPAHEHRGEWLDPDAPSSAPESIEDVVPEQARSTESLSKVLAEYRKTEPINNGIEIGFFEVGATAMLDGESFVTAIEKICAAACDLHDQLTRTESVKDLFLLKQEILNQQEVLRKVYFRIVRFCDKESGVLPVFLEDIVNVPAMRDSLERLTMANWSDPSDFAPFVREIAALKSAYEAKTNPPGDYIQSVLEQIGLN
jgi:hypothetical protein